MNNKIVIGVGIVILVAAVLLFGGSDGQDGRDGRDGLSAQVGPDHFDQQSFRSGFVQGGSSFNASTTLTAARTITAAEFCNNANIHVNSAAVAATVSAASLNITFPATSTLFGRCLNFEGAEKTITFRNNSPTTASTTEMIAGTGCDLRLAETTGADNDIDGLNEAIITIRRTTDAFADGGSVDCIMTLFETVVD